jgi:hypothetical protein
MLSKNKAKEIKRRLSQRRATHRVRRATLTLRAETDGNGSQNRKAQDEAWVQRRRQINRESKQAQEDVVSGPLRRAFSLAP